MNRVILIAFIGFLSLFSSAQSHLDSDLMKSQSYMVYAHQVNCDSMDGNNSEHKICLNLEFQEVDSILNDRFLRYLHEVENDSLKQVVKMFQDAWVINRKIESTIETDGYRGHMLSIAYISNMIFITRKRIEELEHLIEYK